MPSGWPCLLVLLNGERRQVVKQLVLLVLRLGQLTLAPFSGALRAGRTTVRFSPRQAGLLSFRKLLLC